jgi:hypothetical protein
VILIPTVCRFSYDQEKGRKPGIPYWEYGRWICCAITGRGTGRTTFFSPGKYTVSLYQREQWKWFSNKLVQSPIDAPVK